MTSPRVMPAESPHYEEAYELGMTESPLLSLAFARHHVWGAQRKLDREYMGFFAQLTKIAKELAEIQKGIRGPGPWDKEESCTPSRLYSL